MSGNGFVFAGEGNRGSADDRNLRVFGTMILKRGWKIAVKVFTRDKNWVVKSSSGFSCHLMRTLSGCTVKRTTHVLAQEVAFTNDDIKNATNWTTHADEKVVALTSGYPDVNHHFKVEEEFVGARTDNSCTFVCACIQIVMSLLQYVL